MSLKIRVKNRKTGLEFLMDKNLAEKSNHLVKILPEQPKPEKIKVPKEFIYKSESEQIGEDKE